MENKSARSVGYTIKEDGILAGSFTLKVTPYLKKIFLEVMCMVKNIIGIEKLEQRCEV